MSDEIGIEFAIRLGDGHLYSAPQPVLYPSYESAQLALGQLCRAAAELDVSMRGATIVHRMTTPFTKRDALFDFAHQLTAWGDLMGME